MNPGNQRIRAFTLVEVIVAAAITIAIAATALAAMGAAARQWNRLEQEIVAQSEVEFLLDRIGGDLESAAGNVAGGLPFEVLTDLPKDATGLWEHAAIEKPATGGQLRISVIDHGLPATIAYQVIRRSPTGAAAAPAHYLLFRNDDVLGSDMVDLAVSGSLVTLRVLTESGSRQIASIESGRGGARPATFATDAAWWESVVDGGSEVYSRRFVVRSR